MSVWSHDQTFWKPDKKVYQKLNVWIFGFLHSDGDRMLIPSKHWRHINTFPCCHLIIRNFGDWMHPYHLIEINLLGIQIVEIRLDCTHLCNFGPFFKQAQKIEHCFLQLNVTKDYLKIESHGIRFSNVSSFLGVRFSDDFCTVVSKLWNHPVFKW